MTALRKAQLKFLFACNRLRVEVRRGLSSRGCEGCLAIGRIGKRGGGGRGMKVLSLLGQVQHGASRRQCFSQ